ncbi:helix-turn-helix domain-containing protein [Epibacterium ulvae]|uniref:helix-turn-helix domain-containing protein n=1 Tax=Epibacterium ulvae TaxID=1156985 RepID=UPI002490A813|nr:helix-turn-helix transcriptional regulator [Epibacterium ulvae]
MKLIAGLQTASDVQQTIAQSAKARRLSLNITQQDVAARSGVSIATLKRFEKDGSTSLANLLAIAEALDALDEFHTLFPAPDYTSLEELEQSTTARRRARRTS